VRWGETHFRGTFATATPLARYATFVRDADRRRHTPGYSGSPDDDLGRLLRHEADRLRVSAPIEWDAATARLDAAVVDSHPADPLTPPSEGDPGTISRVTIQSPGT